MKITKYVCRIMHINHNKAGNAYVNARDTDRKVVAIMVNRFKRQYNF